MYGAQNEDKLVFGVYFLKFISLLFGFNSLFHFEPCWQQGDAQKCESSPVLGQEM